jgi:hypothetical protein
LNGQRRFVCRLSRARKYDIYMSMNGKMINNNKDNYTHHKHCCKKIIYKTSQMAKNEYIDGISKQSSSKVKKTTSGRPMLQKPICPGNNNHYTILKYQ